MTNNELIECNINTDLSGSTVVAVFIYKGKLICFNVGDSRAVLYSCVDKNWKANPLSSDQKPCRPDQQERIIKFGGIVYIMQGESKPKKIKMVDPSDLFVFGCQMSRCQDQQ